MQMYNVVLAVAKGACLDIGQQIKMDVIAPSRIAAAMIAERLADLALGDETKYTHAKRVDFIPWGESASMAAA